ncbi:glucosaminidase domain-containing protein [Ascidiimonas sp. W6]|uniref:glucosaminidase domain-containing protein n=1 Tax=Ascidiimonas meishanensis TaxID=3128903 RepID=UPI0030EE5A25
MTKKIYSIVFLVLMLMSCGPKKQVVASERSKERSRKKEIKEKKPREWEPNLIPEKFVYFDITSTEHYIQTFQEIAKQNMIDYGIPSSITLAQGILESASGKGELTRKSNNHFGIKCHKGWTGDRAYHDDDEKGECFRRYNHPMYSFSDHSLFLSRRGRYAFLFKLRKDDYKGWARGLRKAGYATDKKYPQKLIALIERYELYRYDREVIKGNRNRAKKEDTKRHLPIKGKMYVVAKGDTLYSISKKYGLTVSELMEINHLNTTNLNVGQELIIKSSK